MKIGDTVAWADVPSGALVRHDQILYMRVGDAGWGVGHSTRALGSFGRYCDGEEGEPWPWEPEPQSVVILALGLTGSEAQETLSMLVRHFEDSAATRQ